MRARQLTKAIAWKEQAACRGLDLKLFYPDSPKDDKVPVRFGGMLVMPETARKLLCNGCSVRPECEAASRGEYGWWAGRFRR